MIILLRALTVGGDAICTPTKFWGVAGVAFVERVLG
jgi:hypothetical protein